MNTPLMSADDEVRQNLSRQSVEALDELIDSLRNAEAGTFRALMLEIARAERSTR